MAMASIKMAIFTIKANFTIIYLMGTAKNMDLDICLKASIN